MIKKAVLPILVVILIFSFTGTALAQESDTGIPPADGVGSVAPEMPIDGDSGGQDTSYSDADSMAGSDAAKCVGSSADEASASGEAKDSPAANLLPALDSAEPLATSGVEPGQLPGTDSVAFAELVTDVSDVALCSEGHSSPEEVLPESETLSVDQEREPLDDGKQEVDSESDVTVSTEGPLETESLADCAEEAVIASPEGGTLVAEELGKAVNSGLADPYFFVENKKYGFFYGDTPEGDPSDHGFFYWEGNLGAVAIQRAIDFLAGANELGPGGTGIALSPTGGEIRVESYEDPYGGFTVDAVLFPHLSTALRGIVWDAIIPGGLDPDVDARPVIDGNINVLGVVRGFTLRGFVINGMVNFEECAGQLNLMNLEVGGLGNGITVEGHRGNISVTNVASKGNNGYGASIENLSGGNVTITNSSFNFNTDGYGLIIETNGIVNANGLSAASNDGDGFIARSFFRLTVRNGYFCNNQGNGLDSETARAAVVVLDTLYACGNGLDGIRITSFGAVNVVNICASGNSGRGLFIDKKSTSGTVNLNGGSFNENGSYGLYILSSRAVTVTSVKAIDNTGTGAYLDNASGSGNITVNSPRAAGQAKANVFEGNTGAGLIILSRGRVTVTNIRAVGNDGHGLAVNNSFGSGNVTVNKNLDHWQNEFSENEGTGLLLITRGVLVVSDSYACCNGEEGIFTYYDEHAPGLITRSIAITRGGFHNNGREGLLLYSTGNITLIDVRASSNGALDGNSGLFVNNTYGSGRVVLRATTGQDWSYGHWYDGFNDNKGYGIEVYTRGTVSIEYVYANRNELAGILIDNTDAASARAVAVAGIYAYSNGLHGLSILTRGTVTLTNIQSETNGRGGAGHGVCINNSFGTGSVTVRGARRGPLYFQFLNYFDANKGHGLWIESRGTITLSNLTASNNEMSGIHVVTHGAVTLNQTSARSNQQTGIHIETRGTVRLNGVEAINSSRRNIVVTDQSAVYHERLTDRNSYYDADRYWFALDPAKENIFELSCADDYAYLGLYQVYYHSDDYLNYSSKEIDLDQIGARLSDTLIVLEPGSLDAGDYFLLVTVSSFDQNPWWWTDYGFNYKLYFNDSESAVEHEMGNYHGAYIDNSAGNGNVIVGRQNYWSSNFRGNNGTGLHIVTNGTVSLQHLGASSNGSQGTYVDNTSGNSTAVTVENVNANSNEGSGVSIISSGAIMLRNAYVNRNKGTGMVLNNSGTLLARAVNITNGNAIGNGSHGVSILTGGAVSVIGVNASSNGYNSTGHGIYINNSQGAGNVLVRSAGQWDMYLSTNRGYGLFIESNGAVTVSGVSSYDNEGGGAYINNIPSGALSPRAVDIRRSDFGFNRGSHGLLIETHGRVFLETITASYNSDWGGVYFNGLVILTGTGPGDPVSNVILRGSNNEFSGNNKGIYIETKGNVALFNVKADNNRLDGIWVDNSYSGSAASVAINVSRNSWNATCNNGGSGTYIKTNGPVAITNINAGFNQGKGIHVVGGTGITIRNTSRSVISEINDNNGYGLYADNISGQITVSGNIHINSNISGGLYLDNSGSARADIITLRGITAEKNYNENIKIISKGHIILSSVNASDNDWGREGDNSSAGVWLDNSGGIGNITVNGASIFNRNSGTGLILRSNGNIVIRGVIAESNGGCGIDFVAGGTGKTVNVRNVIVQKNQSHGITARVVDSAFNLTGVSGNLNGQNANGHGIHIYNEPGDVHRVVSFNECVFIGNRGSGIYAERPLNLLRIRNTVFFGNDTDNTGDRDLYHH